MGMFDIVRVEYPLPDGHDPSGEEYQTKDTPSQMLDTYVLAKEGRLLLGKQDVYFHGDLVFYASNVSGCSGVGVVTSDNRPPMFREYVALFKNGQLIDLRGGIDAEAYKTAKHYTSHEQWYRDSGLLEKTP